MKSFKQHILEKLKVSKIENKAVYHPNTKKELVDLIIKEIEANGPKCSLNHIDVSAITDMSDLFRGGETMQYWSGHPVLSDFDGDISDWDVSNVKYMGDMFAFSKFNGDISNWDVSNVELFAGMFKNSSFNGDISKWKINPKAKGNMNEIFTGSPLENTPPSWYYKYK